MASIIRHMEVLHSYSRAFCSNTGCQAYQKEAHSFRNWAPDSENFSKVSAVRDWRLPWKLSPYCANYCHKWEVLEHLPVSTFLGTPEADIAVVDLVNLSSMSKSLYLSLT